VFVSRFVQVTMSRCCVVFIDRADSIDEQSIQETEFSENQVQITWNEPSSPNGFIATYHIDLVPVVSTEFSS
jgi:hypothetical protein